MTTYYVSTTGSNSQTGSIDKPFASLQYAHNLAQAGDTIFVRGGTYSLTTGMQLTKDGTSGKPITVSNYQGEKAIFDGAKMGGGYYKGFMLDMSGVSWNHIKGLEFRNGPDGGVLIRDASHNNVIENLNVHHIGPGTVGEAKGIMLFGAASNNLLLNNDSHDNHDASYGNADGFQISTTGTGNVLRGNRAWGNSDDGFDLYNVHNGTNAASVVLDGNWAFDNGYTPSHGVGGDGNGFKLGGNRSGTGGTSGGHILTNNIAWDNRVYGFFENGANKALTLYNNTAFDNHVYNYLFSSGAADTLTNNISYGSGKVQAYGSVSNNSWNLSVSVGANDFVSLNDAIARGVRSLDGSLPVTDFLHLTSSSDLIDRGKNVGYSYADNAPDLGGIEFNVPAKSAPALPLPIATVQPVLPVLTASDEATNGSVVDNSYGWQNDSVPNVTKFLVTQETIYLQNSVYTEAGSWGQMDSDTFWVGTKAHDASDRIVYDDDTGNLYYDLDGSGSAAATLITKLAPNLGLTAGDFYIL